MLRSKLILAALSATMLLAVVVSGAAARNLRLSEGNFELIWDNALGGPKTKLKFISSRFATIQCKATLLGSLPSTISKNTGTNQGTINHAELSECEGGAVTIRTETLPWHLRYRSFEGSLPRIRSVNIGLLRAGFRIREPGGLECEFQTEVNHPGVFIVGNSAEAPEIGLERSGEPESITLEKRNTIPFNSFEFLCDFSTGSVELGGIGLNRNLARTAELRFTLI